MNRYRNMSNLRDYRNISIAARAKIPEAELIKDRMNIKIAPAMGLMDQETADKCLESIDREFELRKINNTIERRKKYGNADDYFPEAFE